VLILSCFPYAINDGRRSPTRKGGAFSKKPHFNTQNLTIAFSNLTNLLLLGEGLQDFQFFGEEIYLLLIVGGGHRPVEVLGEDLGKV